MKGDTVALKLASERQWIPVHRHRMWSTEFCQETSFAQLEVSILLSSRWLSRLTHFDLMWFCAASSLRGRGFRFPPLVQWSHRLRHMVASKVVEKSVRPVSYSIHNSFYPSARGKSISGIEKTNLGLFVRSEKSTCALFIQNSTIQPEIALATSRLLGRCSFTD